VRLRRGDFADETVFGDDPVAMAEYWVDEGARYLHVVDLDGAREGVPTNLHLVRAIAESVTVPVQTGGGIRSESSLARIADTPVKKAVLGTSAVEDEVFLEKALAVLGVERVVVAIDAERGIVKTKGWREASDLTALELSRILREKGVQEILYTDIDRDGMMQNVNLEGVRELAVGSGLSVIASGGVSSLDDLGALKGLEPLGVTGVIVGRALYEKRFTVAEALAALDAPEAVGSPEDEAGGGR
jgi:phosphoribosylformimino-5-aminoimidazole carboxamide ribotide isomerase